MVALDSCDAGDVSTGDAASFKSDQCCLCVQGNKRGMRAECWLGSCTPACRMSGEQWDYPARQVFGRIPALTAAAWGINS